jgi:hypothetical protein
MRAWTQRESIERRPPPKQAVVEKALSGIWEGLKSFVGGSLVFIAAVQPGPAGP